MTDDRRVGKVPTFRPALLAGIAGPAAFVAAWVAGGLVADRYSPVSDTISRLAEQGASTRPLMTAGFVGFGVLMPWYARELGRVLGSPGLRAAVTATGVGTLAVAAFPVTAEGGGASDTVHYLSAGLAYTANVVAPLLAARRLPTAPARRVSAAMGGAVGVALIGSIVVEDVAGLLQRTGLTLFDAWAVGLAIYLLARGRSGEPGRVG